MTRTVYVADGGRRFHDDPDCIGLDNGLRLSGGKHTPSQCFALDAALMGWTACRVCVPPGLALPATGETYGHRPVTESGYYGDELVCARCDRIGGAPYLSALWPCMSAVILGLVVTDADRWNARYGIGIPVTAYPLTRTGEPLRTRTRTPAWRLGTGDSLVSVDGYPGGIALTHVDVAAIHCTRCGDTDGPWKADLCEDCARVVAL